MMHEAQLKDVKASLSSVVNRAVDGEPTVITRRGRKEAVVLSFEEYQRLSSIPSLGELLTRFPADPEDLPPRRKVAARETGL